MQRHAGVRPISLIGFSLGARSIFYALVELARNKAYGLVQDVFIFGTTVTASQATWLDVRSVVAGRFVNGFASNDWMLGYLFRATSGGLNTVAGLRAVDMVPGLENIDCTDTITGHMSYRSMMPQLLAKVGFPVSADHFDEPDVSANGFRSGVSLTSRTQKQTRLSKNARSSMKQRRKRKRTVKRSWVSFRVPTNPAPSLVQVRPRPANPNPQLLLHQTPKAKRRAITTTNTTTMMTTCRLAKGI